MFKLIAEDKARQGIFRVNNKKIQTPFFMPVATKAVGRYIGSLDYSELGAEAIISNSFLLSLNPGLDQIRDIHKFMNFNDIIFTDSGGFQIIRSMYIRSAEDGIIFRDPFTGREQIFSPEKVIQTQNKINSDVAMVLDDMSPFNSSKEAAVKSLKNTHAWAEVQLRLHHNKHQSLFGIIQGSFYKDLREKSAEFITSLDFGGIAVGGLAIGESKENTKKALSWVKPFLPENKLRYAMGIGEINDLFYFIENGIDCFDSVFPTQNARHNTVFTSEGKLYIDKSVYRTNQKSLDKNCGCKICRNFSRAYLNYLAKNNDPMANYYLSYHNLYFYQDLMKKIQTSIRENEFSRLKRSVLNKYQLKN